MSKNTPARLQKVEPKFDFNNFCMRIAPYVAIVAIGTMTVLTFAIMIKYGGAWFGTEANHWYNGGI